jgi:hypothetical protein
MSDAGVMGEAVRTGINAETVERIPIFFIIGKGRSGTTLLQTQLDANPHVLIPLESRFIIHLQPTYGNVKRWTDEKILAFYNDLFSEIMFSNLWKVDREKLKSDLLSVKEKATFPLLCKIVYLNYISVFEKQEIRLIGDKNPVYTAYAGDMLRLFPDAKFIHMVRDHRANTHSHMTDFPIKNVPLIAHQWKYYCKLVERFEAHHPGTVLTLRYEDLVSDPVQQLDRVCRFLGIAYSDSMMQFHHGTNELYGRLENFIDKYHRNLLNPVNDKRMEAWKTAMKQEDIRIADHIAGDHAKRYGYERMYNDTNVWLSIRSGLGWMKLRVLELAFRAYFGLPVGMKAVVSGFFRKLLKNEYRKKK